MPRKTLPKRQAANALIERFKTQEKQQQLVQDFAATLSPRQKAFFLDPSPQKACVAGRQSGKTHVAVGSLVAKALAKPNSLCLFIATTKFQSRQIIWDRLKDFDFKYNLDFKFNQVDSSAVAPNGSKILLLSGEADVIEKYRGFTIDLCVVDECASFADAIIANLVINIIGPALRIRKGSIILIGTPGVIQRGWFYDVTTKPQAKDFTCHYFNAYDNPAYPDPEKELAKVRKDNNWSEDNPIYQREYLGKWVQDTLSSVYKFSYQTNTYVKLPGDLKDYTFVLGLDYGYSSASAFVVIGWRPFDKTLYVVHSHSKPELDTFQFAQEVQDLVSIYKPICTVSDPGGGGKDKAEHLIKYHGINVVTAKKGEKANFIQFINSEFHEGRIKIQQDLPIIQEMENLIWDPKFVGLKEKATLPNHQTDAFSYAYRYSLHYLNGPEAFGPKFNTKEFWDNYTDEMWRKIEDQDARQAKGELDIPQWQKDLF